MLGFKIAFLPLVICAFTACAPASINTPVPRLIPTEPSGATLTPMLQTTAPLTATPSLTTTASITPTPTVIAFHRGIPESLDQATLIANPFEDRAEFDAIMDALWNERIDVVWPDGANPVTFSTYVNPMPFLEGVEIVHSDGGELLRVAALMQFDYQDQGTAGGTVRLSPT